MLKKILYIRRSDDVFLHGFCAYLDKTQFKIYVLDLMNWSLIDVNSGFSMKLLKLKPSKINFINYLLRYVAAIVYLLKYSNYTFDIVHVLNIKRENFWFLPFLKRKTSKLIVSVYGRSTYTNFFKRVLFKHFYKYTDNIIFTNTSVKNEFLVVNKALPISKLKVIYLIINQLDYIRPKQNNNDKKKYLDMFGLSEGLIHVCCSSTIASYDQHEAVISEIKKIPCKDKLELMFLLSYGGTSSDREKIIDLIKTQLTDFKNILIIDRYLSVQELACFRMVTDIYINMRKTDQFAAAIIETLAAGSILISGKWLNYELLDVLGIYYKKVESFRELSECMIEVIENIPSLKTKYMQNNSMIIKKNFNKEKIIEEYNNLYNSK